MKRRIIYLLSLLILLAGGVWFSRHSDGPPDLTSDYPSRKDTREGQGITNSVLRGAQPPAKNEDVKPDETNTPRPLAWNESSPDHVLKAIQHGATGKVTFHVCDSLGSPVRDSTVFVGFYLDDQRDSTAEGRTDENGYFTAEKLCSLDANCRITKNGYYRTNFRYYFHKAYTDCVRDGRWIPWNPTLQVTLKEKRKPIPMYQNYIETVMPAGTNRLGFDFLVGDWVAPQGKGTIADMWYVYDDNFIDRDNFYIKLSFVFPGEKNGCYMRKMDNFSELISEHEASDTELAPSKVCVIEQEKGKFTKELRFAEDDYMVFRIRTKTDEQGKIVSSHYGKIYGPVGVPHRWSKKFSFTYYLNPTPNSRNLEYDPQKNLILDAQRHTMNRNLP